MDAKTITLNPKLFNGQNLLGTNKHRLGQEINISYPTILKYIDRPETVSTFNGDVLLSILVHGFGYSLNEISDMKVSDIFAIVQNGNSNE